MKLKFICLILFLNSSLAFCQTTAINNFEISISYFDKIISQKVSAKEFQNLIKDYVEVFQENNYKEFNDLTGEHDLLVYSPDIVINYKGSKIIISLKSLKNSENPIYSITVGFRCSCEWFSIKNQAKLNGYNQIEYSDKPDRKNDIFGGLQIKYRKANKTISYQKFSSKLFSEFSLTQDLPRAKKPITSDDYLNLAKVKYKSGSVMETMANVNKSIELNKNNSGAFFLRGLVKYNSVGENKEYKEGSQTWTAMQDFNKAIELDNSKVDYYSKRAELNNMIGSYDNAILDYQKVIELQPNNSEAQLNLIDIQIQLGNYSNALTELDKFIDRDKTNAQMYLNRALIKFKRQDFTAACDDYKKAENIGFDKQGRLDLIDIMRKCR